MKFLHAADIHLDSPLAGLLARDDLPDSVIRHCTRRAFAALIDLALEEDVAFVVIAGDLYDGDWKDFNTGLFFVRQMGRPVNVRTLNRRSRGLSSWPQTQASDGNFVPSPVSIQQNGHVGVYDASGSGRPTWHMGNGHAG